MHAHRPVVLLTGFGPFPKVPANATSILVPLLAEAARRTFGGYTFVGEVLATEWRQAPRQLDQLVATHAPVLAIHFGVSSRARGFVLETRAVNAAAHIHDACGETPELNCIDPSGADVRATALPAARIVDRLRARGIPAVQSRDAGTYLCNAILYHSRAISAAGERPFRSGFVHLPSSLADERRGTARPRPGCPLDWGQALAGGLEVIAASLGQPSHVREFSRQG